MELKINRTSIPTSEIILDDTQEQGVELNYVLPDYDPDIFRILTSEICPVIQRRAISNDRITYELRVDLRMLYCTSESNLVHCISQSQTYSRSIELPQQAEGISVEISPKTSYVNCRALSPRRLEIRGAISIHIRAAGETTHEVISDVFGMHVQLRKTPVEYIMKKQQATKLFSLSQEIQLNASKPKVHAILHAVPRVVHQECKTLAGKLLVQGELCVRLLYSWEENSCCGMESLEFPLSFSQIVDMEQIDESFCPLTEIRILRCDIKQQEEQVFYCDLDLELECTAMKSASVELVTDAFSTQYLCEQSELALRITKTSVPIYQIVQCTADLCPGDRVPEMISDLTCRLRNLNLQLLADSARIRISGMLSCAILAIDGEGAPFLLEKDEAFEVYADSNIALDNATIFAKVEPTECNYHLSSDGTISIKASLALVGCLSPSQPVVCLPELTVDEESPLVRDGDYALKLYYGVENESVWDIAKRCHTSVNAIMEENDLSEEQLVSPGMLFIPIVR